MNIKHDLQKKRSYIWSDNWYLDGDKAWFISGSMDILFCLDLKTKETAWIDAIPLVDENTFRQHPRCLKYKDVIICLPDLANDIKFYHLSDNSLTGISINNSEKIRIACSNAWIIQEKLYIVSNGLKQIIEIDLEKECVSNYRDLPAEVNDRISGSSIVGNFIYLAGVSPVVIYRFDCIQKDIKIYNISQIEDEIQTLSYDGEKFWLSGKRKKIYVWNEKTDQVIFLDSFPESFGVWNFSGKYKRLFNPIDEVLDIPLFLYSVSVGDYVWFIPFQTNEILYIDKNTFEINQFSLQEEDHMEENIRKQLLEHKYLLEYVRGDRYIGLYSLKNRRIFEIDSQKLAYEVFDYKLHRHQISLNIIKNLWNQTDIVLEEEIYNLYIWLKGFLLINDKGLKEENHGKEKRIGQGTFDLLIDME